MPPLTPGRTYGINFALSGSTHGTRESVAGESLVSRLWLDRRYVSCRADRLRSRRVAHVHSDKRLRRLHLTHPRRRVGRRARRAEYVRSHSGLVAGEQRLQACGWRIRQSGGRRAGGCRTHLPCVLRHLRGVGGSSGVEYPERSRSGATQSGWFTRGGNYSFDMVANDDGPLVIDPVDAVNGGAWFDGVVSRISVREIISDPVPTAPVPAATATSANHTRSVQLAFPIGCRREGEAEYRRNQLTDNEPTHGERAPGESRTAGSASWSTTPRRTPAGGAGAVSRSPPRSSSATSRTAASAAP